MEPVPTDFWGVVVPSWLGAVASIAASTVAVIAFINSLSAKGGVREIGHALNRAPTGQRGVPGGAALRSADVAGPEPWSVVSDGRVGTFRNTSGGVLTVSGIIATAGIDATLRDRVPLTVPPAASFEVRLRSSLASPAVRGVTLVWSQVGDESVSRTYYL